MLCVVSKLNRCTDDQKHKILELIFSSILTVLFTYQKKIDLLLFSISNGLKLKSNKPLNRTSQYKETIHLISTKDMFASNDFDVLTISVSQCLATESFCFLRTLAGHIFELLVYLFFFFGGGGPGEYIQSAVRFNFIMNFRLKFI